MKKVPISNFPFYKKNGFTLIELLVVISLMSILTLASITVFSSFSKSQSYQSSVTDFVATLHLAKSRAINQVKPEECGATVLRAYRVYVTSGGQTYTFRVYCGTTLHTLETKRLPADVSFRAGSSTSVSFDRGTGTVLSPPRTIWIDGNNTSKTITIDDLGNIVAR